MINKTGRTQAISPAHISRDKTAAKTAATTSKPPLESKLVDSIIAELSAEQGEVSAQAVQKKIILKTLMANFGVAASQEPKFNQMFDHVNRNMSENKQAQALIGEAIRRYRGG
ncbi:MAG: hypothetical protein ACI8WB_002107 [Phenylobacterium sp.]|jgi:hypothetical protein